VYDYAGGKMDWLSHDLPYEGEAELVSRRLHRDVPTAAPDDLVGPARKAALDHPAGRAVVTTDDGIVLGAFVAGGG
jgi:CBS domain-containing protein